MSQSAAPTISQLQAFLAANPQSADGWRVLGDAFTAAGKVADADAAYARAIKAATRDPELLQAADALVRGELAVAEPILRGRLKRAPTDVAAIRMLAELASRLGRFGDAEKLLRRALELAPSFRVARHNLALVLHRQGRSVEALDEIAALEADGEDTAALANLKAAALGRIGDYGDALALYEEALDRRPAQPKTWMSYAHALKTVGRQADAVAAYRRAIELQPGMGEAWWSLANLKRVAFAPEDRAAMRRALAGELSQEDRFHLEFALGKAEEDAGDFPASFAHYARGNALRRTMIRHDPAELDDQVARARALFTPSFLAQRQGWGCQATDPIFILGMPRAGSTLLEQVLASHPAVEGTMELPDIPQLVTRVSGRKLRSEPSAYPEALAALTAEHARALGEEYLENTRVQRKTDAPHFIDKLPNNWLHVGLIRLILPNARIIDARRHPLACCFSNFKQHFARGQTFSYSLEDMGHYYRRYTELLAHFDEVQPGLVHRVFYERVVEDLEGEVRRMLAFLGLPFDPACLRYYESERAVRTASSEQVREPIFRQGLDQWRHYEPWLDPLKQALGPALADYPHQS
ncbi:tetratricopeptide repeat-containing sulfotransferase family protein [Alteraurantiacibacter buctensis]|uniref:Tetratricopeptide repeat protein n=1 Tax=Alteraurantiacibacter buctensis TaxID=1503981 RepID=A0A844YWA4_9SPHN|nr:sulfotransferase [Alteraurantiacibacter buctensis]MXO71111.1 tetratricopeptide repeat protein [Alteraurantiacibacter buctensis]